jgi:hypothetical protein
LSLDGGIVSVSGTTVSPTATSTPTPTPEPELVAIVNEAFLSETVTDWTLGSGWEIVPQDENFALQGSNSTAPVSYNGGQFDDVVMEMLFQTHRASLELNLRQTATDAYRLILHPNERANLYRNDYLLTSAVIPESLPNQWQHIRFSAIGDTLRVALNGVEIMALRDDKPLPAGTVAFEGQFDVQTETQEKLLVDKIRIWVSAEQVVTPTPAP